jgi:hypothetical protein
MDTGAVLFWAGVLVVVAGGLLLLVGLRGDPSRGRRRCPRCWYSLEGILGLTCPECGHVARSEGALLRRRRRCAVIAGALAVALLGYETTRIPTIRTDGWAAAFPGAVLRRIAPLLQEEGTRLLIDNTSLARMYNKAPSARAAIAWGTTGPRFTRWERLLMSARCADIVRARVEGRVSPVEHATLGTVEEIIFELGAENAAVVSQFPGLLLSQRVTDRQRAISMLQTCESPGQRARVALQGVARSDPNTTLRIAAMMVLAARYPASSGALDTIAAALEDPDHWIRYRSAEIIGGCGEHGRGPLPILRRRVEVETDEWAKFAAEQAIVVIEAALEGQPPQK